MKVETKVYTTEQQVSATELGKFQKELLKFSIDLKNSSNLSDDKLLKVCVKMYDKYAALSDILKEASQRAWPEMKYIFDMFDEIGSKNES